MGEKRVNLRHEASPVRGGHRSGHDVVVDNSTGNTGPRPTELVLVALASCTAMDVVEILAKKRQLFTRYATRSARPARDGPQRVHGDHRRAHR